MLVILSSYAITTLESLKRYMRITIDTEDDLLTDLINQITDKIERIARRKFMARDYRERISGRGTSALVVNQRPIIYVDRVAYGNENAISISATGFSSANISVNELGVRLYSVSTAGTIIRTNLTHTAYPSSGNMATAIDAVSGWTATKLVDCSSYDLNPANFGCLYQTGYLSWPDQDLTIGMIDQAAGIIHLISANDPFSPSRIGSQKGDLNYLACYNAGYATIPDFLIQLCHEACANGYNKGKSNRTLKSESLGDWSYSIASDVELSEDQISVLQNWSEIGLGGGS